MDILALLHVLVKHRVLHGIVVEEQTDVFRCVTKVAVELDQTAAHDELCVVENGEEDQKDSQEVGVSELFQRCAHHEAQVDAVLVDPLSVGHVPAEVLADDIPLIVTEGGEHRDDANFVDPGRDDILLLRAGQPWPLPVPIVMRVRVRELDVQLQRHSLLAQGACVVDFLVEVDAGSLQQNPERALDARASKGSALFHVRAHCRLPDRISLGITRLPVRGEAGVARVQPLPLGRATDPLRDRHVREFQEALQVVQACVSDSPLQPDHLLLASDDEVEIVLLGNPFPYAALAALQVLALRARRGGKHNAHWGLQHVCLQVNVLAADVAGREYFLSGL
mmetsp:Transcript_3419/g.9205  ORF Transcript_3419/g.9205 Transcript_3419/m.9205 type:complete len:336 (+) Transcript_3419:356-1363(+)